MLDSFLETNIQNKLKIIGDLYFKNPVPQKELCMTLPQIFDFKR